MRCTCAFRAGGGASPPLFSQLLLSVGMFRKSDVLQVYAGFRCVGSAITLLHVHRVGRDSGETN